MKNLMSGKNVVVMGVANDRSLAWGVARSLHAAGANLIFTYRKERSYRKISALLSQFDIPPLHVFSCDASDDDSIKNAFIEIKQKAGSIQGLVHSIAYAEKEDLKGEYIDTSREGYLLAQNISSYSLIAVAREAQKIMTDGGSIVTQTYIGAERFVENYHVMGAAKAALEANVKYLAENLGKYHIRVNAVSSGPIRTLSAKGTSGMNDLLRTIAEKAPLRRNVDQSEVGDATLFLLSPLSRGITGEVLHVDAGYHIR
ncbi:enoyl-ACP reductase FabI [Desmospora activa]|uniref:Enoyl-[acyl-carrier-protein] reductase [NADH] n=1 Tax=Desmospora activa DSM 45169 TaxID=1121389 RepID=A0A2T4ZAB3_9BACL|nr:enoyl-ACP reductase FabI [Desmospora activa]PTM58834.1 enoyl-[acyl-carrier-protein] reductase [NADH] [Desmospora activa DSM 45169]